MLSLHGLATLQDSYIGRSKRKAHLLMIHELRLISIYVVLFNELSHSLTLLSILSMSVLTTTFIQFYVATNTYLILFLSWSFVVGSFPLFPFFSGLYTSQDAMQF